MDDNLIDDSGGTVDNNGGGLYSVLGQGVNLFGQILNRKSDKGIENAKLQQALIQQQTTRIQGAQNSNMLKMVLFGAAALLTVVLVIMLFRRR